MEGLDDAEAVPGVEPIEVTIPLGSTVEPPPEGDRYLGFVFAEGLSADTVEASLRRAAATLVVTIDGEELTSEGIFAALPE